jgi:anti-sigma regulatory factor (Ser/Thr protein kinase)
VSAVLARRVLFALPAAAESVALARGLLATVLRAWSSAVDEQVAQLLVSEVFTNAYRYVVVDLARETYLIEVRVAETFDGVHLEVHDPDQDSCRAVAVSRHDAERAERGRGLMLVEALADQWGAMKTEHGKRVYFDLSARPPTADGVTQSSKSIVTHASRQRASHQQEDHQPCEARPREASAS